MMVQVSYATMVVALTAAASVGSCEAFVSPGAGKAVAWARLADSALANTAKQSSCSEMRRRMAADLRLNMMTGAEAQVTDSNLLFAQMAGCTGLISAGYKITWEKGAEGEGEEEGEEGAGEVDIFRDTALRYLGYANEVGEAFRPLIPEFGVVLSYGVAIAYVTADAVSKGYSCAKESGSGACALPASFDVLTFQMLASVVFPGFTINRWVAFVTFLLNTFDVEAQVPGITSWLPTAAGLALIPFIVAPLDNLVEAVLDKTTRPLLTEKFPSCDLEPIFGAEPLP